MKIETLIILIGIIVFLFLISRKEVETKIPVEIPAKPLPPIKPPVKVPLKIEKILIFEEEKL